MKNIYLFVARRMRKMLRADLPYVEKKLSVTADFYKRRGDTEPVSSVNGCLSVKLNALQLALMITGIFICTGMFYLKMKCAIKRYYRLKYRR